MQLMLMMQAIEARKRWGELLKMVENGQTVAITRYGRVVAHVTPAQTIENAGCKEAVERFRRRRAKWQPLDLSIEEILRARHQGHRF